MNNPRAKRCPRGTTIQTLLFDKRHFTKTQAREWITKYGEAAGKADEKANFLRYRQRDPQDFEKGSLKTITLAPDVKAVIGCPKQRNNPRPPKMSDPERAFWIFNYDPLFKLWAETNDTLAVFVVKNRDKIDRVIKKDILGKAARRYSPEELERFKKQWPAPRKKPRHKNHYRDCPKAPDVLPYDYNPKKAKRTEARRRKNDEIHIDVHSHNAPRKTNPAINIPKTVVVLGSALDMEVDTGKKILLYSWNSPHQKGKLRTKRTEALVCSNTLGNELYILPNKTKHVKPDRLIPLVERHRDAPQAAALFKKWADFPAHNAAVLSVPRLKLHRIGKARALSYFSDKWTRKTRAYIHEFHVKPEVYACSKSKVFTIFSKKIRVTPDGIRG